MSRYFDDFSDEILHYGVKGMKWRKKKAVMIDGSTPMKNRPRGRKRQITSGNDNGVKIRRKIFTTPGGVEEGWKITAGGYKTSKPQDLANAYAGGKKKKRSIKSRIKSALKR